MQDVPMETRRPVWAVVPGRMGSSRLPGKTMADLVGHPSLWHIVRRLELSSLLDGIVIATTTDPADDVIRRCADQLGVPCFSGQAEDVLDRTLRAARSVDATSIVTVAGDCPLCDAAAVDRVVAAYLDSRPDYASNRLFVRTYPIGLDVEVFTTASLAYVETVARAPRDREHVTLYYSEHPEEFTLLPIEAEGRQRRPELRLTLDTDADLTLIRAIYEHFWPRRFGLDDVLDFLDERPELAAVNRHVSQVVP
jgi:spore coat polysaccharide biosynthesis protein SpsF